MLVKRLYVPLMAQRQKKLYLKLRLKKYVSLLSHAENLSMAAFQRMHVSPAKQSDVSLPRSGYQTEGQSDPYVSLCAFQITQIKARW